jgi:solute carrier family 35 protein E1
VRTSMEKFPDIDTSFIGQPDDQIPGAPRLNGALNGSTDRWQSRREPLPSTWTGKHPIYTPGARGHGRQKSLSDAFRTIRTRKGSVSANAHEIAEALRAPVSPKLIVCHRIPPTIYNTC